MIKEGNRAPEFSLLNQNNEEVTLSSFLGEKVLIWFFPKASTSGCTLEGLGFKEKIDIYKSKKINVIGISKDSVKAQKNFCEKNEFPFDILSDPECVVIKNYGAWALKKMYGGEYWGIKRISVLINEVGEIEKIFHSVKTKSHANDVLEEF